MSDFKMLVERGFERTGSLIHKADDGSFFAAVDFKTLQEACVNEVIEWENVLRQYLNFYSVQLFNTMKGKMDLAEVGKVIQTAWEMRFRSVFVFKTSHHPSDSDSKFIAGVGHVRANSAEELLPSEADGVMMPRSEEEIGLEIGRLCLCPEIPVAEKKSVIHTLLKLYVPVLSRDLRFRSMSLRTSRRHCRFYQNVFSDFMQRGREIFLSGDRDVILQIDLQSLAQRSA